MGSKSKAIQQGALHWEVPELPLRKHWQVVVRLCRCHALGVLLVKLTENACPEELDRRAAPVDTCAVGMLWRSACGQEPPQDLFFAQGPRRSQLNA